MSPLDATVIASRPASFALLLVVLGGCATEPATKTKTTRPIDVAIADAPSPASVALPGPGYRTGPCQGSALPVIEAASAIRCAYVCRDDRECGAGSRCEPAMLSPGQDEPYYTTVCSAKVAHEPAMPSLFGAPHGSSGECPRGFAAAKSIGSLCYRSCKTDLDCPTNAACRATKEARLCEVRAVD